MNVLKGTRSFGLLLVLLVAIAATPAACPAAPVNLGSASSFAILAGETITNTGPTTVAGSAGGDIGLYPGTSFTGSAQVTRSGSVHLADTAASQAKDALVTAYNDAAGRTPVTTIATELGGQTLTPGVYDSSSGTFQITGTLTLDANGDPDPVFVFLTSSTLITASDSTVSLINGALPCRVFWKVGSSATLGTNSNFVGHIFALTSIQAQTGAKIQGQLLARNGSVTLDTNTITNNLCVVGPSIDVAKTASTQSLSGAGTVTYTYLVTNPGTADLGQITVTDDKLSSVTYVSGDLNNDSLLQPNEVWVYTGTSRLTSTTTNTATVTGTPPNATPISDTDSVTVTVSTVEGGRLPDTGTPWYTLLVLGVALVVVGAAGWWRTTRRIHG